MKPENLDYHTAHVADGKIVKSGTPGAVTVTDGQWNTEEAMGLSLPFNGANVLDAGCRDGWFSAWLAQCGAVVTGCDWADTEGRKKLKRAVSSEYEFLHKSLYGIKDTGRVWDYVWMSDVLCHCHNPLGVLRQLWHVCGEALYITQDTYPNRPKRREDFYAGWIDEAGSAAVWTIFYPWVLSEKATVNLLKIAGFTNVRRVGGYGITSDHWHEEGDVAFRREVVVLRADKDPSKDIINELDNPHMLYNH